MGLKDIVVQKLQAYFGDYVDGLSAANLEMQARRHPRPMAGCRRPRRPRPRPRSSLPRLSANRSRCGAFLPQVLAGTIKQSELSLKAGKEASQPASQPSCCPTAHCPGRPPLRPHPPPPLIPPGALDALELPIAVRAGRIRTFVVDVPWARLTSQPVVVKIDGVRRTPPAQPPPLSPSDRRLALRTHPLPATPWRVWRGRATGAGSATPPGSCDHPLLVVAAVVIVSVPHGRNRARAGGR
jgi:hypothetical protein